MSWSVGQFEGRDIGYGVPARCDHPECDKRIDRGLSYVCAWGALYGGDDGCGLFFCSDHGGGTICERCAAGEPPFEPTPDTALWVNHKLKDESWQQWRDANPELVKQLRSEHEYPWTRLWSLDYTETLYDSRRDHGTAEDFLRDSGHDWLPFTLDFAPDDWRTRQSGRLELQPAGDIKSYNDIELIQYLTTWPNPHV